MPLVPSLRLACLFLLAGPVLGGPVFAQEGEGHRRAELEFARGLAERFGYLDLAEEILDCFEQEGVPGELADDLVLVRAQIRLAAARRTAGPLRRLDLYEQGLATLAPLLDDAARWEFCAEIGAEYVAACVEYLREVEPLLAVTVEEEKADLHRRLRPILERGLELTSGEGSTMAGDRSSAAAGLTLWNRLLHRSEMLIAYAEVVPAERVDVLEEAERILEVARVPSPWERAELLFIRRWYAEAREWYARIEPRDEHHQRARVQAALCLYEEHDVEGAKQELQQYLGEQVADPAFTGLAGPVGEREHREAMARATFYLGRIAFAQRDHEQVIELFADFAERFCEAESHLASVFHMLLMSHRALRRFEEAEAVEAVMRERGFLPQGTSEPKASLEGFRKEVYKKVHGVELAIHICEPRRPVQEARDPRKPKPRPAIVFFFGGGWNSGSVLQFVPHCRLLAGEGFVAMVADYRVRSRHGTTPFECVEDGKSAVRWIRANAERLHVDPDRVAAGGGSAGGHVAAATATVVGMEAEGEDLSISSAPNALVLFNPVFDNGPGGFGHDRLGDRWREISPLHNIRAGIPPAIVFLGTEDPLVPVATAEAFRARMQAVRGRCELRLFDGEEHGFFNSPAFRDGASELLYGITAMEMRKFLRGLWAR